MEPFASNFIVLNRQTSEQLLNIAFSTKTIFENGLLMPLISSVDAINAQMQNGHFRELHGEQQKIVAMHLSKYTFVVQTKLSTSSNIVNSLLKDLCAFLEFTMGPSEKWDHEILTLNGMQHIFNYFFETLQNDLGILIGGYKQLHLQKQVTDHIDWLLMQFESQPSCKGALTLLLLDDLVVTSRFPTEESRNIIHFLKSSKAISSSQEKKPAVQFFPCHHAGGWKYLYIYSIEPYTMAVLAPSTVFFHDIADSLLNFKMNLFQSRLDIPIEDVQLPLRQFAKRDTLALLYHNIKTGLTLMPALRPGPEVQALEILKGLVSCINESSANLQITGTSEWIVYRRQHMYFARSDGVDRLYLLISLSNGPMDVDDVLKKATEIIKSIRKLYHQL